MFAKTEDIKKVGMFNEKLFIYFSDDDLCKKIRNTGKHIIQIYRSKCVHVHGISKVKNKFKRVYLKELYFTLDELMYFKNINNNKIDKLRSKLLKYFFRVLVSLFLFRLLNFVKYIARIYAYIKFKMVKS